jgi:hypothetical protein
VPVSEEVELPPVPSFEPEPAPVAAAARSTASRLGREDLRKLHAALHELGECRKLLEGSPQGA